jgi:hypothetical protein
LQFDINSEIQNSPSLSEATATFITVSRSKCSFQKDKRARPGNLLTNGVPTINLTVRDCFFPAFPILPRFVDFALNGIYEAARLQIQSCRLNDVATDRMRAPLYVTEVQVLL